MSEYERVKNESAYWYNRASDLRGGAAAVWASLTSESNEIPVRLGLGEGFRMSAALPRVYRLLCGLSLELLLKSIVVARGKKVQHHHRLIDLGKDAEVPFEKKHEGLLKILTEVVYWSGKYPTPKGEEEWGSLVELEREHLFDKVLLGESGLTALQGNGALDWEGYSELWGIAFNTMSDVVPWLER
jgi:hypothetical protein